MIGKVKAFEIGEIHFEKHLNTYISNMFLTLKLSYSFLCYSKYECII
jgi:hypothetical protein